MAWSNSGFDRLLPRARSGFGRLLPRVCSGLTGSCPEVSANGKAGFESRVMWDFRSSLAPIHSWECRMPSREGWHRGFELYPLHGCVFEGVALDSSHKHAKCRSSRERLTSGYNYVIRQSLLINLSGLPQPEKDRQHSINSSHSRI